MPLTPIQIPAGLERNGSPYDTPGQFWDMNLMRWQSGSARPVGGWVRKTEAPLDSPARRIHAWRKNGGEIGTLIGTDAKLYVDFSNGWLDITPSDIVPPVNVLVSGYGTGPYGAFAYGTARPIGTSEAFSPIYAAWSFANWGEDVLFVSSKDNRLFHYVGATPDMVPVAMAEPPLSNAVGVTDERYVMLVGPVIDGTYYPYRVCWASRESLTDWDFANVANSAGFFDLQCSSPLSYIVRVKEGMLLFTSTEVFLARYVGLPYVYGFEKLAEMPIMHPYSIAAYGGGYAMWMSPRAMQGYAGGVVQPVACPIFNDIQIDFSTTWGIYRSHAGALGQFPEVWFFWPSTDATECDRYAVFNYLEGWWGWGYLKRTALFPSGALRRPLMGAPDGNIYQHEDGWTDAGLPILGNRWLETGALGIAQGSQVMDVKQALLATDGRKQSVKLQFFGRYAPDGDERIFGPYTPRLDGYTDTRVNCREARIRYIGNIDGLFEVGQLRLDLSAGGER